MTPDDLVEEKMERGGVGDEEGKMGGERNVKKTWR